MVVLTYIAWGHLQVDTRSISESYKILEFEVPGIIQRCTLGCDH